MTSPAQPPVVPGRHETYTLSEMMPPVPKARRPRVGLWIGIGAAVVVAAAAGAFLLDSRGNETSPAAAATSAAASPTPDQAMVVECTNIERAYNAWAGPDLPSTAFDVSRLNSFAVDRLAEDGKDFLKAVEGYTDQASKALAVAVANYGVEIAMANVQATALGGIDAEQAEKTFTAITKVHADFTAFKLASCA